MHAVRRPTESHAPTSLDTDAAEFRDQLTQAAELVMRLYEGTQQSRITPAIDRREVAALFDEALPGEPQAVAAILREVEEKIFPNSTFYSNPRFFGYINGSGNQAALLGEILAASINQICAKWHFSPAASEVERRVVRWLAQFIGYVPDASGCLLSGGSAGNLVGLAMARRHKAPFDTEVLGMREGPPLTVYVSEEGHASIEKSMVLLGMGRGQLRKIETRDDFTIDLAQLEKRIVADRASGLHPVCVVASAGTTNTGAVDPVGSMAQLCRAQDVWLHVDAAYGGPAAATELAGDAFVGLDEADSVVVNPHKWLFVPVEAACILVRDPEALRDTFRITADYLHAEADVQAPGLDFKDLGPQLSRSFRALKVWMTFKAYGARRLRAAIENDIAVMRYLADRIDESQDFVRLAPVPLSVVCFQYRTSDVRHHGDAEYLDRLNRDLARELERDGRVFLSATRLKGRTVLRACSVNHRLTRPDVDFLLTVIREVGTRRSV